MVFFMNSNSDHNAGEVMRKVIVMECALAQSHKIELVNLCKLPEIHDRSYFEKSQWLQDQKPAKRLLLIVEWKDPAKWKHRHQCNGNL